MTQERTYTLIERDHYGAIVNTITGIFRARADLVAETLRLGDAYTDKIKPWTCEIVREPSREEQIAAVVDEWLADAEALTRADHLVACLRRVADVLEPLGDKVIPRTGLKVELHLFAHAAPAAERMAALDELAAVFGHKGEMSEAGHYHTGYVHGGGLRIVTIAEPEPKPIVSDETIRQAEQLSRMVLPMAECGCPIWGTVVDHCAACREEGRSTAEPGEHRHVGGSVGGPGENSAECACGTTFAGFDTHAEPAALLDKHIANETAEAAAPIAAERVEEILAELNALTQRPDEAAVDWWDWISDQPEFDREATAAAPTGELHLVDGTVLVWQATPAAWKRVKA